METAPTTAVLHRWRKPIPLGLLFTAQPAWQRVDRELLPQISNIVKIMINTSVVLDPWIRNSVQDENIHSDLKAKKQGSGQGLIFGCGCEGSTQDFQPLLAQYFYEIADICRHVVQRDTRISQEIVIVLRNGMNQS